MIFPFGWGDKIIVMTNISAYLEIIDCARAVEVKNGGMDTFNTPKYWELYSAFRV